VVRFEKAGYQVVEVKVDVSIGVTTAVGVNLRVLAPEPPPRPEPPPEPPPPPPRPAPPPPPRGPRVHIESEGVFPTLALYRVDLSIKGTGYERPPRLLDREADPASQAVDVSVTVDHLVCTAPCDEAVGDQHHEYYLGGEGLTSSSRFWLDRPGFAHIKVSPGGSVTRGFGTAMVTVGGVASIIGTVALPLGISDPGAPRFGGAMIGAGTALIGGGIALLLKGSTTYSLSWPQGGVRF
jgi:hypothetical protein